MDVSEPFELSDEEFDVSDLGSVQFYLDWILELIQ